MPQGQLLLIPDPRPLVERLGAEFFRRLPEGPGVYLMRDEAGVALYVGKAKNLRRRLGSYRVANPDRMGRRHLRLLRAVARIEIEPCEDEAAALATEARLLRSLQPRFNRAGTWPAKPQFLAWRQDGRWLELAATDERREGWETIGPAFGVLPARNALARLLWRWANPDRSLAELPQGWVRSMGVGPRRIDCRERLEETVEKLRGLIGGAGGSLVGQKFEAGMVEGDFETVSHFCGKMGLARKLRVNKLDNAHYI